MDRFECKNCEKTFSTNSNLERHVRDQHNTKWFKCEKCGSRIKNKNNFQKHKKTCKKKKIHTSNVEVQTEAQSKNASTQTEDIFIFSSKEELIKYFNQGIKQYFH